MIPKALCAALASAAPVGTVTATCSARVWSRMFPGSCKVQAVLWDCGHCVSARAESRHQHVGTGWWAGSRLDMTFLSHKAWQEPLGTVPTVTPGHPGTTEPWPELPSPPTSKLSWFPGAQATAIRAAQAPHSMFWTDPSTTARGQRGWIPTMAPGTPWCVFSICSHVPGLALASPSSLVSPCQPGTVGMGSVG